MSSNIEIQKKCKWCGQIFIARKTSTNYCSHKCNNAAYKERIRQERIATYQKEISINAEETSIENKEFYTPPEVAKLLGISRASIYRYMAENIIKAVQFKGKTLVRRKDIELLFENAAEYKKRIPIKENTHRESSHHRLLHHRRGQGEIPCQRIMDIRYRQEA